MEWTPAVHKAFLAYSLNPNRQQICTAKPESNVHLQHKHSPYVKITLWNGVIFAKMQKYGESCTFPAVSNLEAEPNMLHLFFDLFSVHLTYLFVDWAVVVYTVKSFAFGTAK